MINQWAHFLAAEKLTPKSVGEEGTLVLLDLATALAKTDVKPRRRPYAFRQLARKTIVNIAMDLGIDLPDLNPHMGRGLLDVWAQEYIRRFGSAHGTNAWHELKRRSVVTKLKKRCPYTSDGQHVYKLGDPNCKACQAGAKHAERLTAGL